MQYSVSDIRVRLAPICLILTITLATLGGLVVTHSAASGGCPYTPGTIDPSVSPNGIQLTTYNTYLKVSETVCDSGYTTYGTHIFLNNSFFLIGSPVHTFGLGTMGGNTTLTGINADNVQTTSTEQAGKIVNITAWYNSLQSVYSDVDFGSTHVLKSSFITNYTTWSTTSGTNVYWNSTGDYIEIKATSSSTPAFTIWFSYIQICFQFVRPDTNPLATQLPTVSYTYNGGPQTSQFGTSKACFLLDSGSIWSIENPFYYDNFARSPSPATGTAASNTNYSISFTQNAIPVSSNPFTNLIDGQIILGVLGPYINLISLQWFLGIILMAISAALYLKSYNPWIPITMMLVFSAVFVVGNGASGIQSLLPNQFNLILYITTTIGISGTIYKAFSSR